MGTAMDTSIESEFAQREAERKKRDEELLALLLLFLLGWAEDEAVVALGKMLPEVPGELAQQAGTLAGKRVTAMAATMARLINNTTDHNAAELVEAGMSWESALKESSKAAAEFRADLIADDEAYKARIVGQFAAADALRDAVVSGAWPNTPYPVAWKWSAYPGCCGVCGELSGQTFDFDANGETVTPNGDVPGAIHPACRCTVQIVMSDNREVDLD